MLYNNSINRMFFKNAGENSLISTGNMISLGRICICVTLSFIMASCNIFQSYDTVINYEYNFRESDHNWEAFFTNYNVGWEDKMELTSDYKPLPKPLNTNEKALYISGTNNSDDLKMLFRKKVDGLEANTTYNVSTTVRFATEEPSDCVGIGGAPGEAVRVISAASAQKPEPFIGHDDYYMLNVQHENDSNEWYQSRIMGNIANSRDCEEGDLFEIKEISSDGTQDVVRTNKDREAWLLFGTRSGFEGKTELYFTYFRAEFRK